ncbi:L-threonylcarbamoyladenylate synthase [uncultured Duncaniella sp.]|uniref:L-threonylcarbamoyladenylate synthase n=1 Tax=uncultured Duncaniella sp. TaxID=2768039 RepID=UPI0025AFC00B|nr:L-threonylcarbamoyladenylate synthase [uncultured Duncaniella sp.]
MKTLRMYPTSLNERFLDEAVDVLEKGGIIIYPTDTLYAMGCDALNNGAIERLCKVKGVNPQKQTLSIVCDGLSMASEYARIDNEAFRILRSNLPGPFTFILPAATTLPKVFKGRRTVGVRIPDNPISRALSERLGHPVLSTSIPQDEGCGDPSAFADEYAGIASLLIDGGEGDGIPSTVVDLTDSRDPEIVRDGKGELI